MKFNYQDILSLGMPERYDIIKQLCREGLIPFENFDQIFYDASDEEIEQLTLDAARMAEEVIKPKSVPKPKLSVSSTNYNQKIYRTYFNANRFPIAIGNILIAPNQSYPLDEESLILLKPFIDNGSLIPIDPEVNASSAPTGWKEFVAETQRNKSKPAAPEATKTEDLLNLSFGRRIIG